MGLKQGLTLTIIICPLLIEIAGRKICEISKQSFLVWGKRRSRLLVDDAKRPEIMPSGVN